MSNSSTNFRHRIGIAEDLQGVVRTMKAIAASSIEQYENSVRSLSGYYRAVELGLGVYLRATDLTSAESKLFGAGEGGISGAIVFGSDQGLVGQFNDTVAERALEVLRKLPGEPRVWAVGERVHARLVEGGLRIAGRFEVPNSVKGITPLIGQIQLESEAIFRSPGARILVIHNRPLAGASYTPTSQQLLPLDNSWRQELAAVRWPNKALPELVGEHDDTLQALIREYLFISLYQACAESLASENASRLAAMERADRNIAEMLESLRLTFNRERQRVIDEELFDVISGFEALSKTDAPDDVVPENVRDE
jgi:F-type H+-transporting ATPase subunit gamma